MTIPTLDGITVKTISSARLTTRVLFSGDESGTPVLFLHGNLTSATWWEETMLALPDGFFGIAPDQRGFGDADPAAKIDATRGMRDLADDAVALLDALNIAQAHVVGNSLGGSVVWQMMADYPDRLLTVTQVAPGSPYGYGATKDVTGTPTTPDFAGSGGGLVNPEFVKLVEAGDTTADSPFSPRNVLRTLVFRPPFIPAREDALVASLLTIHCGERDWPGDKMPSSNWPYVAPGKWGVNNALSPKYLGDVSAIYTNAPNVPVLWIRGDSDVTVSDAAAADPGTWGHTGLIPNYPGAETYPPQPMLKQTRAVLEEYAVHGGSYREVVIAEAAHVPFIEKPDEFNAHFHEHLIRQK